MTIVRIVPDWLDACADQIVCTAEWVDSDDFAFRLLCVASRVNTAAEQLRRLQTIFLRPIRASNLLAVSWPAR